MVRSESKQGIERSKHRLAVFSALAGVLLGGSGVFGVVRWLDTRHLTELNGQYRAALAKSELIDKYSARIVALESQLAASTTTGSGDKNGVVRAQLAAALADLGHLLERPDLPGWTRDSMIAAQQAMKQAIQ